MLFVLAVNNPPLFIINTFPLYTFITLQYIPHLRPQSLCPHFYIQTIFGPHSQISDHTEGGFSKDFLSSIIVWIVSKGVNKIVTFFKNWVEPPNLWFHLGESFANGYFAIPKILKWPVDELCTSRCKNQLIKVSQLNRFFWQSKEKELVGTISKNCVPQNVVDTFICQCSSGRDSSENVVNLMRFELLDEVTIS